MDCLSSTLSHCALNHTRLESLFRKKQILSMHAHKPRHTHASHVHSHNMMYAHVYTCTHCGRKGHLAKFCYDCIHDSNLATKFVWVRKGANPWTQKSVGTKDHPYCIWCRCRLSLDVRALVPWWWMLFCLMDTTLDASPSRKFGGRPPWFGDLEISPNSFGNYL